MVLVTAKKNAPFVGNFEDLPTIESAQIVGAGFNARTGQSGLMQLLTWTYTYNQTWQSPSSGVVYKIPDQLMLAEDSYSSTKVCLVLSTELDAYVHAYFSWDYFYGVLPLVPFIAYAKANELLNASVKLQLNETFYGWSEYNTKYYSLDMAPAYLLQPNTIFKLSIEGLPESYNNPTDLQKYEEFVTSYGTHYVCFADMGGTMHSANYISKAVALSNGLEVTAQQMLFAFAITFFGLFTAGFQTKGEIQLAAWFADNQEFYQYFYGGNVAYQSNTTLAQWMLSIPDSPSMLNKTLCPISMLVNDATKQASLESYITEYVNAPA